MILKKIKFFVLPVPPARESIGKIVSTRSACSNCHRRLFKIFSSAKEPFR